MHACIKSILFTAEIGACQYKNIQLTVAFSFRTGGGMPSEVAFGFRTSGAAFAPSAFTIRQPVIFATSKKNGALLVVFPTWGASNG